MDVVGCNVTRKDAWGKVLGRVKYTDDYTMPGMLHAKIKRSTIAAGRVVSIDVEKAKASPGVKAVFTYQDVPQNPFATAGHPYVLEEASRDVEDRLMLTGDVRLYGDEIAVVVADSELAAEEALALIEVEYEEYAPILDGRAALRPGAREIHEGTGNIIKDTVQERGDVDAAFAAAEIVFEQEYATQLVQHCALENHTALAYLGEDGRVTVVSSTQIPHIARRVVGQALGIPWGRVRIIKPCVGGGFGSKQDVVLEPLAAFLTTKLQGRPVRIRYSREETFLATRTRHPMHYKFRAALQKDGTITAWECDAVSTGGGYASHGHSTIGRGGNKVYCHYPIPNFRYHAVSTYTNTPVAGAMRAYGTPQVMFFFESAMEDMARQLGMDPVEFRQKNMSGPDLIEPATGRPVLTHGLAQCYQAGMDAIHYREKQRENEEFNRKMERQGHPLRRGVAMSSICYNPFAWPGCLEMAGAHMILNQDGSVVLHVGATEIGQGSDTALAQIAAEAIGIPYDDVLIQSNQDTDISPFDTGAFSSRQTYVSGQAVKLAGLELRDKILQYVHRLHGIPADSVDIAGGVIRYKQTGQTLASLADIALNTYYNKEIGQVLSATVSHNLHTNGLVFGACFVQVEVDISLAKVKVLEIYDVMDVGRVIHPGMSAGQVHGGVSMGLGYALSEELMVDPATGKVLNPNLLDYKLQTTMDTPDIGVIFVENPDPTGPYGNKGLGEPPTVPVAPAIRNAVLAATGVAVNQLPLRPQKLYEAFVRAGLVEEAGGDAHV